MKDASTSLWRSLLMVRRGNWFVLMWLVRREDMHLVDVERRKVMKVICLWVSWFMYTMYYKVMGSYGI